MKPLAALIAPSSLSGQPRFNIRQVVLTTLCAFVGIAALGYLSEGSGYPLVAAPFGASSVLLYALPESPLAQPRNVLLGNCLGALLSILCVCLFGSAPWVMGLAVASTIALTQITRSVHPPAGAVALVGVLSHASWAFLWTPVFAGSLLLVTWTCLVGLLFPERRYPRP